MCSMTGTWSPERLRLFFLRADKAGISSVAAMGGSSQDFLGVFLYGDHTRWAPTSYKWSYFQPYKWPYKWVTGVITLLIGVITPFITSRGPTL